MEQSINKAGRKKKEQADPELLKFGNKIYNLRTALNYSYGDLEKITREKYGHQIARASWSHYEHGTADPSLTNLRIMADMFHVTTDYLIGLTDKPNV